MMPGRSDMRTWIKKFVFNPVSIGAVRKIVASNPDLQQIWDLSQKLLPDVKGHFTVPVDDIEVECRIRLLICFEVLFIQNEVAGVLAETGECSYMDVGDSDGSVRLMLQRLFPEQCLNTLGINLQQSAVDKMNARGLPAICDDALKLGNRGERYDLISVFETLEHLPDPIGFLKEIKHVTSKHLILSVPYIRRSRLGLAYLSSNWPLDRTPTIENTHIFELSPEDWQKLFRHCGWEIVRKRILWMYPMMGLERLLLQPFWRMSSFEGFWFVSLRKNSTDSDRYVTE